ncbi:MAG: glycosyltransferase [Acidobacteriaceae bacterium]|nr:glycosyltransferase [Acidobacteriaceae bacterium]
MTFLILLIAAIPFVYYLIAIWSSWRFFSDRELRNPNPASFTPPVSCLKPVKGTDPDAYENFASFCRQDYPDYELLFCVDSEATPVLEVLEQLKRDFPERAIRVLFGSGRMAANDKAAKLARLVSEARHEVLVISDSDVRARPDYLKTVVAPLGNPEIGAVTLPYLSIEDKTFADRLQSVGMLSDFYAGILVAKQLDGVKFAIGPTIATTRSQLARFGGYEAIENRPGDDLLIGRSIAEQGYRVELLPYTIDTVADFGSLAELWHKRLRWLVVMRYMRPAGHLGLLLTQGLFWSVVAAIVAPSMALATAYLSLYLALRIVMTMVIGSYGFKLPATWRDSLLIPVWDAMAFLLWLASFTRRSVRWRGNDYYIREGQLVPVVSLEE